MTGKKPKVSVPIPPEVQREVEILRREEYSDKSYSEVYRTIIKSGIETANKLKLKNKV